MSLACKPNNPTPSYTARIIQETNRNIGLSSVFNVQSTVSPCVEAFSYPTFTMSGATKAMTGLTISSDSTYNLSNVDDFDVVFNFTGNTQYTGYTGQFCHTLNGYLPHITYTTSCVNYSGLTGSSLTKNIVVGNDISIDDNEYVLNSWNIFDSKCVSGLTINTNDYSITKDDFYLVTIIDPPKPTLGFTNLNTLGDLTFINELLSVPSNGTNQLLLSYSPVAGTILMSVNGIQVSRTDYTINPSTNVISFLNGITLEQIDVVQVYYNKTLSTGDAFNVLGESVNLELVSVTGITSGFTSNFSATTYNNIVNYNDDFDRLELFLQKDIDLSVIPIVSVNGTIFTWNVDVYKSNVVNNKLIFNSGTLISVGDVISVYYYSSQVTGLGDLGRLRTTTPKISWSVPSNVIRDVSVSGNTGLFTVEVVDRSDINYNTILNSGTTIYNNTTTYYTIDIGPITTTSISNYIYRIKFTKDYTTSIVSNTYQTEIYSDNGSFSLDWGYINNTKF